MKKQIKTLVATGLITIVTASSMVTSHADTKYTICTVNKSKLIYVDLNDLVRKLKITCPSNKPVNPGDIEDNNIIVPDNKPEIKPDNKPEVKPEVQPNTSNNQFVAYQKEVLDLVNKERAKVGASPLKLNAELSKVATEKSQDMINKNYFDHISPIYGSPFDMMKRFGISYKSAAENIAMGQKNPSEVMNSWMNSNGHRKNILSSSYTEIGVGIAKASNGQLYWTQMFIGK